MELLNYLINLENDELCIKFLKILCHWKKIDLLEFNLFNSKYHFSSLQQQEALKQRQIIQHFQRHLPQTK